VNYRTFRQGEGKLEQKIQGYAFTKFEINMGHALLKPHTILLV
jgi:hypothetical protein